MEQPTQLPMSMTMMLTLTRCHTAAVAFKKTQVDVSLMIDPTRSREECEASIDKQMDTQTSKNAVTGVPLPAQFTPQDYSKQLSDLRAKRKADNLTKPARKAKRTTTTTTTDPGEDDQDVGKSDGPINPARKTKRTTENKSDDLESDDIDSEDLQEE
ncbi:hypothetical protein T484DRAFT_1755088 [Baffinella frigidus]|nr:hypothetical protein T484DRAFT_1755088 [Cryptophyta sp. CCMP2293]